MALSTSDAHAAKMLRWLTVTFILLTKYMASCLEGPDPIPPDVIPPDLVVGTQPDAAGCGCQSLKRASVVDIEEGGTTDPSVKYSKSMNQMPSNLREDAKDTTSQVVHTIRLILMNDQSQITNISNVIVSTFSCIGSIHST